MDASQTRREFKFLLPAGAQALLLSDIAEHLPYDRGQDSGYSIVSEYYDSLDFRTYWQKRNDHPNRRRLRTRIYQPNEPVLSGPSFIEIKHRLLDTTVKRRLPLALNDIKHCANGFLLPPPTPAPDQHGAQRIHAEIVRLLESGLNVPTVRTCFHRFAFDEGSTAQIRITFDDRLRTQLWQNHGWTLEQPLFAGGDSIMEVKSIGAVPYWLRSLVAKYHLRPRGISKYATTLDAVLLQAA